ncbi:MAG: DEAD/DEAH box helicase [Burkholderiaceae bacterium]
MSKIDEPVASFRDFGLPKTLLSALDDVGYETPSPIQQQAIPHLLQGLDLLGNAPTGTGKTAAFALPLIARLDLKREHVQILVLTPTRELAIQVAEAFQRYAAHLPGFKVLPVYGGSDYGGQIRQLSRGVHAVVGTPGRIMDHMRRGTLVLDGLRALVLDEADEMLRMGFIEDVEWILEQTPAEHQMALFSATMPREVQRIARRHLRDPQEVTIASKTATAETIRQRYWYVSGFHKLDALTRILEVEDFDALIIFVRTKLATVELAERLQARGLAAAPLNGDMVQKQREQMIERLKGGTLDIVVATDVAARGLDVERISHVINYDIPYDTEAYIHRIGRTGRAGRSGEAILFVTPREQRMLTAIERATRQKLEKLQLPTTEMVNNKRIAAFKQNISDTLAKGRYAFMQSLVEQYQLEHDVPALEIAAALATMVLGDRPLLLENRDAPAASARTHTSRDPASRDASARGPSAAMPHASRGPTSSAPQAPREPRPPSEPEAGMERYRIEVGFTHGVRPANIVGAIANEAGLDSAHIGRVDILDDHSLVDLPAGMPRQVFLHLQKVWVCQRQLRISRLAGAAPSPRPARGKGKRADDAHPSRDAIDAGPAGDSFEQPFDDAATARATRPASAETAPAKPVRRLRDVVESVERTARAARGDKPRGTGARAGYDGAKTRITGQRATTRDTKPGPAGAKPGRSSVKPGRSSVKPGRSSVKPGAAGRKPGGPGKKPGGTSKKR